MERGAAAGPRACRSRWPLTMAAAPCFQKRWARGKSDRHDTGRRASETDSGTVSWHQLLNIRKRPSHRGVQPGNVADRCGVFIAHGLKLCSNNRLGGTRFHFPGDSRIFDMSHGPKKRTPPPRSACGFPWRENETLVGKADVCRRQAARAELGGHAESGDRTMPHRPIWETPDTPRRRLRRKRSNTARGRLKHKGACRALADAGKFGSRGRILNLRPAG